MMSSRISFCRSVVKEPVILARFACAGCAAAAVVLHRPSQSKLARAWQRGAYFETGPTSAGRLAVARFSAAVAVLAAARGEQ